MSENGLLVWGNTPTRLVTRSVRREVSWVSNEGDPGEKYTVRKNSVFPTQEGKKI